MKIILLGVVFTVLLFTMISSEQAFADVTIVPAAGSAVPGCEETSSGCFIPSVAVVSVGDRVIFSNTDTAAHTFTSGTGGGGPSGEFDTGLMMAGNSFEYSPNTAGTIPYFCVVHPWMEGLILVEATEPEPPETILVNVFTNKNAYNEGETIIITGSVDYLLPGTPMSIIITSPSGNLVSLVQVTVGTDKQSSTEMTAGGVLMKAEGTYTIVAQYGNESNSAKTTFYFSGSTPTPFPSPTSPVSSNSGKISVSGTSVSYSIIGGKLFAITPDQDATALIVSIDATNKGSLTLTIPRTVLDSLLENGDDDNFFILIDGIEVDFDEKTTSSARVITIEFLVGDEEIEIIGTRLGSEQPTYTPPTYTPPTYTPPTYTPTPAPYVPPLTVPSGVSIVIPSGTGSPGCERLNSCFDPNSFIAGKGSTVTWFNADSAAHTVTSGTPSRGPSEEFDSGLFMSGISFSHKFNDAGTYPYFCMVHPWMEGYVIIKRGGTVIAPIPTPTPTPTPTPIGTLSVSTDDRQYGPSELVTVKVSTSKSANVAVSVIGPGGDSIVSRSVTTDSRGSGLLQFKLPESSQNGSYRVDTTATISGSKVSDSTTFTVKSTSVRVSIVSLQPTDQQGNVVSSFTKGKLGFVKVILSSDASVDSLVTINLFDSDLTSLGIGSFKTTLSSGQSEMTLSFFIPSFADSGNGDIYANMFSDWPSQGGVPLTGESSTQVRIQ